LVRPEESGTGVAPQSAAKLRFVSEAVRYVAGGDEQLRGGVVAHAVHCEQRSGELVEERLAVALQRSGFVVEGTPAASDTGDGRHGRPCECRRRR
jgi:hypothetical protein